MPYVLKNDPINLYFLFRPGFEGNYKVTMKFTDPVTKKIETQSIVASLPHEPNF